MPLALLFIGILAVIVAIKGNYAQVAQQLTSDFSGSAGFIPWVAAIVIIAIVGKAANVPNASKMFIALIILVYLFANSSSGSGIWSQIQSALQNVSAPAASDAGAAGNEDAQAQVTQSGSAGTNSGGLAGLPISASVTPAGIGVNAGVGPISIGGGFSF